MLVADDLSATLFLVIAHQFGSEPWAAWAVILLACGGFLLRLERDWSSPVFLFCRSAAMATPIITIIVPQVGYSDPRVLLFIVTLMICFVYAGLIAFLTRLTSQIAGDPRVRTMARQHPIEFLILLSLAFFLLYQSFTWIGGGGGV